MLGGMCPKKVPLACTSQFCVVQEIFHFEIFQSREILGVEFPSKVFFFFGKSSITLVPCRIWMTRSWHDFFPTFFATKSSLTMLAIGVEVQEINWSEQRVKPAAPLRVVHIFNPFRESVQLTSGYLATQWVGGFAKTDVRRLTWHVCISIVQLGSAFARAEFRLAKTHHSASEQLKTWEDRKMGFWYLWI